jgi:hypothetical protein
MYLGVHLKLPQKRFRGTSQSAPKKELEALLKVPKKDLEALLIVPPKNLKAFVKVPQK